MSQFVKNYINTPKQGNVKKTYIKQESRAIANGGIVKRENKTFHEAYCGKLTTNNKHFRKYFVNKVWKLTER